MIAVEPSGRLTIIEVKLARNAEARRAVIAQVLAYAAYLRGTSRTELEEVILARHLAQKGYANAAEACDALDQTGSFDTGQFYAGLDDSLRQGRFRLVIVLDEAPEELTHLVAYLESVADKLVIDLIAVSSYQIGESQILVPQRVESERQAQAPSSTESASSKQSGGYLVEGAADFVAAIDEAKESQQPMLRRLSEWALALEREGLVRLATYHGKLDRKTLLPRLQPENVGLVTIWNDHGKAALQLWRSVFERRARQTLPLVEELIAPSRVGQGTTTSAISDELLTILTQAHREATR